MRLFYQVGYYSHKNFKYVTITYIFWKKPNILFDKKNNVKLVRLLFSLGNDQTTGFHRGTKPRPIKSPKDAGNESTCQLHEERTDLTHTTLQKQSNIMPTCLLLS